MNQIKVTFSRFIGPGTQNPVFKDRDGNEYFWPGGDNDVEIKVVGRHFWDELGYNQYLTYTISAREEEGVKFVSGVHKIK